MAQAQTSDSLTSVVGSKWPGARFRVDFDDAAIRADPTIVITMTFSVAPDQKNFRVISTGVINGGATYAEKGDTIVNFPVAAGSAARLAWVSNKPIVATMSMGAK